MNTLNNPPQGVPCGTEVPYDIAVPLLASLALLASACGDDDDTSSSATDAPAATEAPAGTEAPAAGTAAPPSGDTCVEGDTVKLGFLNSTSGPMAISEQTVRDSLMLAAEEINAAGGILGKQIEFIEEDGQSEPTVFAEKINKLLTEDKVAAVFGGWTSASRKAMLPVVEGANGLLFYPVQYEGLEASPNIYYTGATTNQQIIPAMDFLKSKGVKTLFLAGSDYVFPRTANKIIKQYAKELGIEIVGEEYVPLDSDDWTTQVAKIAEAKPDFVFNTINGSSNVGFIKAYDEAGLGADNSPIISVSIAEEEAPRWASISPVSTPPGTTSRASTAPRTRRSSRPSRPSTERTGRRRTRWKRRTPRSTSTRTWSRRRSRSASTR